MTTERRCEYCIRRVMWDDGDYHCEEDGEVITNGVINASNLCEGFEEDK